MFSTARNISSGRYSSFWLSRGITFRILQNVTEDLKWTNGKLNYLLSVSNCIQITVSMFIPGHVCHPTKTGQSWARIRTQFTALSRRSAYRRLSNRVFYLHSWEKMHSTDSRIVWHYVHILPYIYWTCKCDISECVLF